MRSESKKLIPLLLLLIVILLFAVIILGRSVAMYKTRATQTSAIQVMTELDRQSPITVIEDTHEIHKSIIAGDANWLEIRTKKSTNSQKGLYELWLTRMDSAPILVDRFDRNPFSDFAWEMNAQNSIDVSYWFGGPEGGTSTRIIYDHLGKERARVTRENLPFDGNTFTFGTPKGPTYTVSLLMKEPCSAQELVANQGESMTAEVELQGISISYGRDNKHDYLLPETEPIKCGPYDGVFLDPAIKVLEFDENRVDIELTDGVIATISKSYNSYGTPVVPTVTFKQ